MELIEHIFPELFLSVSIMTYLILGVFIKNSYRLINNLAILTLFFSVLLVLQNSNDVIKIFNNNYIIDSLSIFAKVLTLISCMFILVISNDYVKSLEIDRFEYPILILTSVLGMVIMISSYDLIIFYMGLELQSLSLYVLATINTKSIKSSEAGLKYFILSALSSGLLLYGCSLLYGYTKSTNFEIISNTINSSDIGSVFGMIFVIVGLAFKVSAVPFHMWTPDVYEGSPTSVTSFFALVPKVAALIVFLRFMYFPFENLVNQWQSIVIFLSIASMVFGAVAAIGQSNIKRLMAYSSIGHMGYALAGLATNSIAGIKATLIYLTIYLVMNLGAFASILMIRKDNIFYEKIGDLSGLHTKRPLLALGFLILFFSLAGIPPLAGFFAKFYIFMAVIESKMYMLAIIGLVTTVISAFYYLKIIKTIYFDEKKLDFDENKDIGLAASLVISCILVMLYFLNPSILPELVSNIKIY